MDAPFLFVAEDPGGMRAILPAARALRRRGHDCVVYARGVAGDICCREGAACIKVDGVQTLEDVAPEAMISVRPNVLITGTSLARPSLEIAFWKAARTMRTSSLAVLDAWCDYGGRFRGEDYGALVLPDRIAAMDAMCLEGLVNAGVPKEQVSIVGQPYLDDIAHDIQRFGEAEGRDVIARCGLDPSVKTVLFVFEPLGRLAPEPLRFPSEQGLSDRVEVALEHTVKALERLRKHQGLGLSLLVKLHPRNRLQDGERIARDLGFSSRIPMAIVGDEPPRMLALAADAVVGLWSMLLVEATLLGRNVVSIALSVQEANSLVVNRLGLTRQAQDPAELLQCLEEMLFPAHGACLAQDCGAAARSLLLAEEGRAAENLADLIISLAAPCGLELNRDNAGNSLEENPS